VFFYEALTLYRKITESFPKSTFFEQAQFKETLVLNSLGADSIAISKLLQFANNYPKSRYIADALFLISRWERKNENYSASLKALERIKSEYYYSPLAAQAQTEIAEIYSQMENFQSAIDNYQKSRDLWNEFRVSNGVSMPSLIHFKEAQALENLGAETEALGKYLTFIRENPEHESLAEAMLAVGRISQKQNDMTFATKYYESILQHFPQPEYQYESRIAIGDILFQMEKYTDARIQYLGAIKIANDISKEKYPTTQAVRCLYKLRQIDVANTETEVFKKRFEDAENEEAQLLFDKGKAYIAEKNFELAEKTFKKLKKDFENTDFGAKGELGLGEVYLITNHTEDALKILANIPAKYPNSEVTPLTYFNLGDFYFKSQQVENAISAFKQVLKHTKAGETYPKALRYLIKCYDHLRLWDQAIASTREYLEKYPDADSTREYLEKYPDADGVFSLKIQLGLFLIKLKEYDRAIIHFRKLQPYVNTETDAEVQYYIGRCFMEMGNFQRAASEYLKVKYLTKPTKLPWDVTAQYEASLKAYKGW